MTKKDYTSDVLAEFNEVCELTGEIDEFVESQGWKVVDWDYKDEIEPGMYQFTVWFKKSD